MNSNAFASAPFESAVLGAVAHPINIIREYRRVLPKSAARIVSAIDGWVRTHQKNPKKYSQPEWVYAPAENLAQQIDLCRDTVQRWLHWLVEQGYLIRQRAYRWPTDRAYKYCISDKLWSAMQSVHWDSQPFDVTDENQAMDSRNSGDAKQMFQPSMPRKSAISYLDRKSSKKPTQEEGRPALEEKEEKTPTTPLPTPKAQATASAAQQHSPDRTNVPAVARSESETKEVPASERVATVEARVQETNLTEEVRDRLAQCEIPLDKKVVEAIGKHHISQVYGALTHVENTWETIDNPRGVFLFQLPQQPIEKLGARLPVYTAKTAPGTDIEPAEPPAGFFDALRQKFNRKPKTE